MQLSSTAVINAILSINSDIAVQKDYLDSADVDPAEQDGEIEILEDLEQSLMEFIELYKKVHLKNNPALPSVEELLQNENDDE